MEKDSVYSLTREQLTLSKWRVKMEIAKKQIYLLKDLEFISGLSVYTIKYYLKIGLIKEIGKTPKSNFRYFDNSTLDTLKYIRKMRLKGYSLSAIKNELSKISDDSVFDPRD